MLPRTLLLAPIALALTLAGCDGQEGRVTALSEELSATQAELDQAMEENARLQEELQQARAQSEAAPGSGAAAPAETGEPTAADAGGGTTDAGPAGVEPALGQAMRGELEAMVERLTVALAQLEQADVETEGADLTEVRQSVVEAVRSAETLLLVVSGPTSGQGETAAPGTPAETTDQPPPEIMEEAPAGDQEPAQQ